MTATGTPPNLEGRSGGRAEQFGQQGGAVAMCAYVQMREGADQVETEVEERAAPLFFDGERGQLTRAFSRQSEPYALVDGLSAGA